MNFIQMLLDVLINPSPSTFQRLKLTSLMPERDAGLLVMVLTLWIMLVKVIAYAFYKKLDYNPMTETLSKYGADFPPEVIGQLEFVSIFALIIRFPLVVLISSALLYGCAKAINPQSKGDFIWQTYMVVVALVPVTLISSFVGSFPTCGYCFSLIFSLYHLVQLFSIAKGEHNLTTGQTIWTLVAHQMVFIVLYCSLIVGIVSIGVITL